MSPVSLWAKTLQFAFSHSRFAVILPCPIRVAEPDSFRRRGVHHNLSTPENYCGEILTDVLIFGRTASPLAAELGYWSRLGFGGLWLTFGHACQIGTRSRGVCNFPIAPFLRAESVNTGRLPAGNSNPSAPASKPPAYFRNTMSAMSLAWRPASPVPRFDSTKIVMPRPGKRSMEELNPRSPPSYEMVSIPLWLPKTNPNASLSFDDRSASADA